MLQHSDANWRRRQKAPWTAVRRPCDPSCVFVDDPLAERVAALAAKADRSMDAFVEWVRQGLVDADIELPGGIPVFRMPRQSAPIVWRASVFHWDVAQVFSLRERPQRGD